MLKEKEHVLLPVMRISVFGKFDTVLMYVALEARLLVGLLVKGTFAQTIFFR